VEVGNDYFSQFTCCLFFSLWPYAAKIRKCLLAAGKGGIISSGGMKVDNCIFCKIVRAEAPADIVYENEDLLAFRDINPQAPTHVLVVTKKHFQHLDELPAHDLQLAGRILLSIKEVAQKLGVAGGYKVLTNCGEAAGQVVPHLHFHLLAGKKFLP
jgi:histidine triad (HIT) family protein